jgi:bacillithiol biosynthesis deacetylase BshB1
MLDLLAFGAHPDDVEIGAGGILAVHARKGYTCGIIDLTAGEMASNGTVPQRRAEGKEAAEILRCGVRECLELPDTNLTPDQKSVSLVIAALRRWRPRVVLAPYFPGDRHPDHNAAGELLRRAVFLAGLHKLPVEGEAFRPQRLYFFLLTVDVPPDIIVDISSVYTLKKQALNAHRSQFSRSGDQKAATEVNDPYFLRYIESRDAYFGSLTGVQYGEGLVFNTKPLVDDLLCWGGMA